MSDPKVTIEVSGECLVRTERYANGSVMVEFCAIGRSTPWSPKPNPFAGIQQVAFDRRDRERSNFQTYEMREGLMLGTKRLVPVQEEMSPLAKWLFDGAVAMAKLKQGGAS